MNLNELKEKESLSENLKLNKLYVQFRELIAELNKKELPQKIFESINLDIENLNASSSTAKELMKLARQKQTKIIKLVEKELKIVPKNYYRNLWLPLGMSAFGLPIGVGIGLSIGNIGLLAIGLPIGMAIGIVVGTKLDKKADLEGRQLNVEIKH